MTLDWACPRCRRPLPDSEAMQCADCGYALRFERGVWCDHELATPEGFSAQARDHLSQIESRHFWFGPRDRLLRQLSDRHVPAGGEAVEIGCGSGRLLTHWRQRHAGVVAMEAHAESLREAAQRGSHATLVQSEATRLPFADDQFAALYCFDVLEHVPPDALLGEMRRVARGDAWLLLSVPAGPGLWSYADELAGHRCRYDVRRLSSELAANGWALRGHTHYQCLLFPALWFSRKVLGQRGRSSERQPARWLGRLLGHVNSAEAALAARMRLPFGSSLMAWAQAR